MNSMLSSVHTDVSNEKVWTMSEQIEWILIKDAAEIADMHIESIRRLCRKGSIECRQLIEHASAWEVNKDSLIRYLNTDKQFGGRPPKNRGSVKN